jgi:hypothetical protein
MKDSHSLRMVCEYQLFKKSYVSEEVAKKYSQEVL